MDNNYHLLRRLRTYIIAAVCVVAAMFVSQPASAQYFGQNKVRYKRLDFKVYKTPHFEIYYYMKNDSLLKRFAQESELWYTLHQQVFRDTFRKANPVILYANHPDFQQTTAIDGEISVGTGGVTEGLKNRVVMPIMETNQTTRHVLGHELVHAFQYHILMGNDTTSLDNIGNIPLWMVEGMAEYLSIGKKDAYTAMWMRDAYQTKDIPSIKDLTTSGKYFPYRYGEAFWSFLGSTYGDSVIVPFFKNTARFGLEYGIRRTFGYDERTLSALWKNSITNAYKQYDADTAQAPTGRKLIDSKTGGDYTVAPSVSPDGKYMTFLSSKELFTIDLFLADAQTGKILNRLTSKINNTHIDEFNFIESAGGWSADGKKFAFSVFSKGRNKLIVVSIPSGKVLGEISMGKAEQFSNITWSPDGENVAFQALVEGQGDLYSYSFKTKEVTQLTNDKFSDYQPNWSRDGKKIIYSTDRATYDKVRSQDISFNLAEVDVETKQITDIPVFTGANNLNPVYSSDGKQVYFLSNRDGFRNIYRYTFADGKVEQMTKLFTGISGITEFSPALSVSANNDIVYSYYKGQKHTIYTAKDGDFKPTVVGAQEVNFDAAMLPPFKAVGVDQINSNLNAFLAYPRLPADSIKQIKYRPQFKLDYLASNGVGVGVSNFGTGLASGVQGVFSDILGRNQIYAGLAVNGEIYDFGGMFTYINQAGRWNFGGSVSHIPFQYGSYSFVPSTYQYNGTTVPIYEERYDIIRIFQDRVGGFTSYPLSRINRIEFGAGAAYYSYRVDRFTTYRDLNGSAFDVQRRHIPRAEYEADPANRGVSLQPFSVFNVNTAFVGDNAYFGIAAPLNGFRYRIGGELNFGTFNYFAPTIDLNKYQRIKPITLAARFYSYGRFGGTGNSLYPLYLGYPFLIRGYESQTFTNSNSGVPTNNFTIDQLSGNRMALTSFEIRLPFTGPEKLTVLPSKFLFSELNVFFDAGLAWNGGDQIDFAINPRVLSRTPYVDGAGNPIRDNAGNPVYRNVYSRVPALSTGVSLRVNMFGYFVLEPYLAWPINRSDVSKPVFGLGFTPGW
ncbi:DPP IV N-terminal domain-containing protein [Mucilaginibacter myungsuensis]|uniref:PD40 domain-containing protein n=1 Tax=Mucilaginibacter myungsuensis TaxID=649104 RepID=A0A929PXD8_9SPHI|nr:DPP IV N-terminal domain-containing protein [Mucilaginibacter myungsuensis]MBE9662137.1 PD40 domain-containing protein [Mucilaginibacter myungsuensis]MDN3599429.1 DPP IV N-terminal domain-containing protein [Mucilaginibacter myungsuensis]